jgi:hypothetical protein
MSYRIVGNRTSDSNGKIPKGKSPIFCVDRATKALLAHLGQDSYLVVTRRSWSPAAVQEGLVVHREPNDVSQLNNGVVVEIVS